MANVKRKAQISQQAPQRCLDWEKLRKEFKEWEANDGFDAKQDEIFDWFKNKINAKLKKNKNADKPTITTDA